MNRNRRILFLLFINLGLAFLALYVLDMLQVIDYKQILSRVPFIRQVYAVKVEDPYLLEKAELEKKQKDRSDLQSQIAKLTRDREEYVNAERKRLAAGGKADSFDEKVAAALHDQAARKGIIYK